MVDSVASAVFVVPFLMFTGDWTAISGELSYGTVSLGGFASFTSIASIVISPEPSTTMKAGGKVGAHPPGQTPPLQYPRRPVGPDPANTSAAPRTELRRG